MSIPIISEICYTFINCLVVKKICQLKNIPIMNIYRDTCNLYFQRKLVKCELCDSYVIELAQHVHNHHKKTMSEYKCIIKEETKF